MPQFSDKSATNGEDEKQPEVLPVSLDELGRVIATTSNIVCQYITANGLPQPSQRADGPSYILPTDTPKDIQVARQRMLAAALELFQLGAGPSELLPNLATGFQYISCLKWLCQYKIFHLVPKSSSISYTALSSATGVSTQRLKSVIRMSMTAGLFRECWNGQAVEHSAASVFLARDEDAYAYAAYMSTGSASMALQMAEASTRWGPDSTKSYETAFNIALDTDLPFFDYLSRNPTRMALFSEYMQSVRSSDGVSLRHLISGFAWNTIRDGGVVVDVGGSTGSAAMALAEKFPQIRLVVQDLPKNEEAGRRLAAESKNPAAERVTFQSHDFTNCQPLRSADVYLLRMILHDWPDEQAAGIIRNLADAMDKNQPNSRLLIMDTVLPTPGSVPVSIERLFRVRDLTMWQAFNSKERDIEDWKCLLQRANPGLEVINVAQPFGSAMSILEVAWKPQTNKVTKSG